MEIDTIHYHYGAQDKMRDVLADYKALAASKNVPYGYQVNWDMIGAQGNSVTLISYAENAVAMAEQKAAISAMMENDDDYKALLKEFLAINTNSQTMHTTFNPEASINMPASPSD